MTSFSPFGKMGAILPASVRRPAKALPRLALAALSALLLGLTPSAYAEATLIAHYRMEETSWNGTAGEVADSTGNYPGTAASLSATKPTTASASPAIPGSSGTGRYGVFNRSNKDYVALPASFPNLGADGSAFTIKAWIRTTDNTQTGQRIFIDDEHNTTGYGFSLGDGGTGKLRLYTRGTPSALILDTGNVIASNTWYFVAAVADVPNKTKRIYVFDSTCTLKASVQAVWTEASFGSDSGSPSIGGETNASDENSNSFGFAGNIDEVRIYQSALSYSELATIAFQRQTCSGALDHLRIEHTGSGVTCAPTTLTIRVASIEHLIAMKTGTGRSKDAIDIEELRKLQAKRAC